MISKALIKHIASLHQGKFRDMHSQFIAEGDKLVKELLHSRFRLKYLCAQPEWIENNHDLMLSLPGDCFSVTEKELERISALVAPNSVLAVFEIPQNNEPVIKEGELVLMLDDIRDPGNLGTIIRTAAWFGIEHVICSQTSVGVYNPKTVQATMGSIARVNIHYCSLTDYIKTVKSGAQIFAAMLQGENIYETILPHSGYVIIGSESHGLSSELVKLADRKLYIPPITGNMSKATGIESLNASVAAAIVCSEFRRRKTK